jgi:acyl-CoA oxidase
MPEATNPDCLLGQYEAGLAEEALTTIESIPEGHRSDEFNRQLIPRCRPIVEAIGHRMVYEAAVAAGVDADLVSLFEIGCIKENLSWYIENGRLDRAKVRDIENAALDSIDPQIDSLLDKLEFAPYVTAPIISDELWEKFAPELETYKGNAEYDLFGTNTSSTYGEQDIVGRC